MGRSGHYLDTCSKSYHYSRQCHGHNIDTDSFRMPMKVEEVEEVEEELAVLVLVWVKAMGWRHLLQDMNSFELQARFE
jgi:hypothetical protein